MIRNMIEKDFDALYEIYQYYVNQSVYNFDITPMDKEAFIHKLQTIQENYPVLVALKDQEILGYAYGQPAFLKEAYQYCVETSIYFKDTNHHGLSKPLMQALMDQCIERGFRWLIACITDTNTKSLFFHRQFGFKKTGALPQCGYKWDQWNGVVWMCKDLMDTQNQYIASNATVVGDVLLGNDVNIWYNAVIRGDSDSISIGESTNIQESVIIHTDTGYPVQIGKDCTIGHGAIVHGATVEEEVLIGMGAILLNGCKIGKHSIIGAGALVTEGMQIPEGSVVVGSPAKVIKKTSLEQIQEIQESAKHYVHLAKKGME